MDKRYSISATFLWSSHTSFSMATWWNLSFFEKAFSKKLKFHHVAMEKLVCELHKKVADIEYRLSITQWKT